MRLWIMSLATVSMVAQAANNEETLVVTQGVSQEPTAPVTGIVATKTLSATKTSAEIVKTPQSVSVITRDQMAMQDVTSVSQALRYSAGVFTEYRGSSNRNDEVFVRGFSYVPKFLDGLSFGATASSQTGTIDPWLLERVEMIRGPASVLFGQVNP
ncbi:TonB-dependent receptor plug domain-containing protein, partial [Escherichia coli]|nr:TonB-dependent receptor plug domain-containing protein [Escherichia coli]